MGMLQPSDVDDEVARLLALLRNEIAGDPAFLLVSGGLDSDVAARLTVRAVGAERVKLATVLQDDMNCAHLEQARALGRELGTGLIELDLRGVNLAVLYRLALADPAESYNPLGLLDPARMKCSLRTVVMSSYQDRGYVVVGTSNLTEAQLGFFLPFGDGIWHVGPLAHLYKTEVRLIAAAMGTTDAVQLQPPSAGFWSDQTDREDMGFWLVNEGPIQRERDFDAEEVAQAAEYSSRLNETDLDALLLTIREDRDAADSAVPGDIAAAIAKIVEHSSRLKTRPTGVRLTRRK